MNSIVDGNILVEMKKMLLVAPDGQLDKSMFPLIKKWDEPNVKSIQILEVLDHCIYAALASGFTINLLQTMLDMALANEGQTLEDILPYAVWRNAQN